MNENVKILISEKKVSKANLNTTGQLVNIVTSKLSTLKSGFIQKILNKKEDLQNLVFFTERIPYKNDEPC